MSQVAEPVPSAARRLRAGDAAPDLDLPAHDGTRVRLADLRGEKVVVYFYPAAMTPGCTTQACDFRDSLAALTGAGYRVLGVSPDPVERLAAFAERDGLTFPLLSDTDRDVMTRWGAWGEKTLYGRTVTGVVRSTVVVDEDGTVALARYNVRATGHVASLRKALGVDA
ncbi:thioredoxin-dependent thiol peroxidase [Aquipuribacter sp. SD81]|uniref:thioredoxin-dependent thiol peroxidase n=1 Tax=Aquipuribacter sp. SD81 TaxID=3127703 RepID=UPI00301675B0